MHARMIHIFLYKCVGKLGSACWMFLARMARKCETHASMKWRRFNLHRECIQYLYLSLYGPFMYVLNPMVVAIAITNQGRSSSIKGSRATAVRAIRTRMRAYVLTTSKGHYAAAAYKAKTDDSGVGYTAYRYIGGLNLRDLRTQLASDKVIAHVNSCMDHQKVVGQMPYLPHRLRRPC